MRVYLIYLLQVSSWLAGFLLQTQIKHLHLLPQTCRPAPPTSADYCTAYLDVTLPSPTRPSLRMSVPRNIPATLLTLPKTHPGRGYRLVGELGSPAMWHSCLGVRQCYGGYLEDGNRLFVIFFCFIYGETLCRLIL